MSGDTLTIVLFLVGTGLAFGQTALSQAGIKHPLLTWGLAVLGALFVVVGGAWPLTADYFPAARGVIAQIATSPVAWFAVLVMGLTASLFFPRGHARTSKTPAERIAASDSNGTQAATQEQSQPRSDEAVIWNFDRNFLGMSGSKDGVVVSAFQGSIKNDRDTPLENISGLLRRRDGKTYPLCAYISRPVKLEDTSGIPPHSEVTVLAPFYEKNRYEEYIPIIPFIADFPPLLLHIECGDLKYDGTFSKEDVQRLLIEFTNVIWEQHKPKITLK